MNLYFARHGESEANRLREFSNRGLKHGLTEKGRQQAAALADRLKDASVVRVFSSPLLRAVQTAEILSQALAVPYAVTDALREYDCGVLEGRSDEAGWRVYDDVLDAWVRWGRWERQIEGGESFLDMRARFVPFIKGLVREYQDRPADLVLVGHGGLYRCMLPLILVNVDFTFALEHPMGATAYVVAEPGPDGLRCLEWCGQAV